MKEDEGTWEEQGPQEKLLKFDCDIVMESERLSPCRVLIFFSISPDHPLSLPCPTFCDRQIFDQFLSFTWGTALFFEECSSW